MKDELIAILIVLVAGSVAAFASGCSSSKYRNVDVSMGEYYSEDEYELLSPGRKSSYCQDLQLALQNAQTELETKNMEIEDTKDLIKNIRRQIVPIETEVRRLESDIRSLTDEIETVKALPSKWRVRPGESLTSIAMMDQIYNDIDKWERIWQANLDKIDDPYYIFPDTVLVIPRDWPTD